MMNEKKRIAGLIAALAIIGASIMILDNPFSLSHVQITAEEGIEPGKKLPTFSLLDMKGNDVSLSDYQGQNLIINSWAAWCPFCINEMPHLQEAAEAHDDVTVLFVHRTKTEPFSVAEKFLDDFVDTPITDPVLLDPEDSFYTTFFGLGMPVSLFVDKQGIIRFKKVGSMDVQEVSEHIKTYFSLEGSLLEEDIKTLPDGTFYLIDPSKFHQGCPVKDCIPSIDNPQFVSADGVGGLPNKELGLGIVHKGEARFYPFRIIVTHEIVNDVIQGDPVLITYCPLCFTGVGFIREIDGEAVEFGVSGKLFNSELVMYDRKTESYWPQSLGKAVVGPLTGKKLQKLQTDTVTWGNWAQTHPDTIVLSTDTGFLRSYDGFNPYGEDGNFQDINTQFPLENRDDRLLPYEVVYGIEVNGEFKAYAKKDLEQLGSIEDVLGGEDVTITFDQDLGSARASAGEQQIIVETLFWFAWAAFHPDTQLFRQ